MMSVGSEDAEYIVIFRLLNIIITLRFPHAWYKSSETHAMLKFCCARLLITFYQHRDIYAPTLSLANDIRIISKAMPQSSHLIFGNWLIEANDSLVSMLFSTSKETVRLIVAPLPAHCRPEEDTAWWMRAIAPDFDTDMGIKLRHCHFGWRYTSWPICWGVLIWNFAKVPLFYLPWLISSRSRQPRRIRRDSMSLFLK